MSQERKNAEKPEEKSPAPARPPWPEKSGTQGSGQEWTGEGDSSIERGQRGGVPSKGGGSQWTGKS
jgi:hypothetical protein